MAILLKVPKYYFYKEPGLTLKVGDSASLRKVIGTVPSDLTTSMRLSTNVVYMV